MLSKAFGTHPAASCDPPETGGWTGSGQRVSPANLIAYFKKIILNKSFPARPPVVPAAEALGAGAGGAQLAAGWVLKALLNTIGQ